MTPKSREEKDEAVKSFLKDQAFLLYYLAVADHQFRWLLKKVLTVHIEDDAHPGETPIVS